MNDQDIIDIAIRGRATGSGLWHAMRSNPKLFAHLKQECKRGKTPEEWVVIAEKLAEEHNGILPRPIWLEANGYKGLYACIRRCPSFFKHIKQDRKQRPIEEWVSIAEGIAKDHDGVIPRPRWLIENGYSGLARMMKENPDEFKHISQNKMIKIKPESLVPVVEKLAKDNGGILQKQCWLHSNGYSGVVAAIKRHPELFTHIQMERVIYRNLDEWVVFAEKLAEENGGVIRAGEWLNKNGHYGLKRMMKKFPERFAHIKQERENLSVDDWVVVADRLAVEHEGLLPHYDWLANNGYTGLCRAIRFNPDKFLHLLRDVRRRTPKAWVIIADKLVEENNGIFPTQEWLKKNGYGGLSCCVCKHPEFFKHIKRNKPCERVAKAA